MRKIRKLPKVDKRVETGAIRFGDDWPGLFVRGDDLVGLMYLLNLIKDNNLVDPFNEWFIDNLLNDIFSATGGSK